jgi:TRAP-type mannitol/chloroaromatic compound transport system substrate-binding protein
MVINGRVRALVSVVLGIVFVAGLVTTSYAAEKITVRIVAAWPKAAQFETQHLWMSSRLSRRKRTKYPGQLLLDYKGAGEVIPTQQQVEALRSGIVDMILTASYYTPSCLRWTS